MEPQSPKLFNECPFPRQKCETCHARTEANNCTFALNKQALADWLADYIAAINKKQFYTVKDYGQMPRRRKD